MNVIFNADDFGLAYSFTQGAKYAHQDGVCSSVSIRVNGPAYKFAVKLLKEDLKGIGVGIHLSLEDGKTKTPELADGGGYYKYNFADLFRLIINPDKKILRVIEKDLRGQIEEALNDGLRLDHADSERYVHMIPPVFGIVCRLSREYKIKFVRIVREPMVIGGNLINAFYPWTNMNFTKLCLLNTLGKINLNTLRKYKLKSTDAFYGVFQTNNMNTEVIEKILQHALYNKFNNIEILSHPGFPGDTRDKIYTSRRIDEYANQKNRAIEAEALADKRLKRFIRNKNIKVVSCMDLK